MSGSSWQAFQAQALQAYEAAIAATPTRFQQHVEAYLQLLADTRTRLDRIRALLRSVEDPELTAKAEALEVRYQTLAAGVFQQARKTDSLGAAPVVVGGVVVAGVLISVAGVAWAIAAYQYAVNLREHTALLERELEARVAASQQGRALQPSTLPPPAKPSGGLSSMGTWLLGGMALIAAATTLPALMKR